MVFCDSSSMMEDNEKPFACSVDGCLMRFTNEDHLTVHKKKHDMVLNLGSLQKSNVFTADQTPTPTRFIRNCEEVGLFQDLQNVNPFEETFRKAFEASKAGITLNEPVALSGTTGADDTLHTPHVFPHIIEDSESIPSILSTESLPNENGKQSTVRQVEEQPVIQQTVPAPTMQVVLKTTDEKFLQLSLEQFSQLAASQLMIPVVASGTPGVPAVICDNNIQTVEVTSCVPEVIKTSTEVNGSTLVKLKLKQTLENNSKISNTNTPRQPPLEQPNCTVVATETPTTNTQTRKSSSNCEDDEKRKRFLERNRAAAMRCREKRKSWIKELEKRADNLQTSNDQLQAEVASLRTELTTLKALLLQHKNCSVSLAMMENGHVTSVEADSTNTATTQRIRNSQQPTSNKPIVAKQIVVSAPNNEQRHVIVLNRPSVKRNVDIGTPGGKKRLCVGPIRPSTDFSNIPSNMQPAYIISTEPLKSADGTILSQTVVPTAALGNFTRVPEIVPTVLKSSIIPNIDSIVEQNKPNQQLISLSVVQQNGDNLQGLVVPSIDLKSIGSAACNTNITDTGIKIIGVNNNSTVQPAIEITPSMVNTEIQQEPNSSVERDHSEDSDIEVLYESKDGS